MNEIQQQLIDKNTKEIEENRKEAELTRSEIARIELELKVEKKTFEENLSGEKQNPKPGVQEIIKQMEVNIEELESILVMEEAKLKGLEIDFEILKLRQPILKRDTWF